MKIFILVSLFLLVISCSQKSNNTESAEGTIVNNNDTCIMIDEYLSTLEKEQKFSGGLLIVKDGEKIFCKGYGWADIENEVPFNPNTLSSMGSITKAFTAAAILKLVEEGKLNLEDNLKKFFPKIPDDKAEITLHHLLSHSSGFPQYLKNDGGDYARIETKEFLERLFSEKLRFKPGVKGSYSNLNMSLLGIIIEQVSGMDYEEFLKKYLFEPIGIKRIGYHFPLKDTGNIAIGYEQGKKWGTVPGHILAAGGGPFWNLKANGGLEASLNEMYLWINAISKHSVLNEESLNKMFSSHVKEEGYEDSFFGYGCNLSKTRRNTILIDNGGSNGVYFARMARFPEEGVIFYMVSNESNMPAGKILPNVGQLYFYGEIKYDGLKMKPQMDRLGAEIYDLIVQNPGKSLKSLLIEKKIEVEDDMVLLEIGRQLKEEKNDIGAFELYLYYVEKFPDIVFAWNELGDLYLAKNEKGKAISCYESALKVRPDNKRALNNLAKLR